MLTPKEKRFLKYWDDQKEGGRRNYILAYTIAWAIVAFFVPLGVSIVINVIDFFQLYRFYLWQSIVICLAIGFAAAYYMWEKNEKKAKDILAHEGDSGTTGS